MMTHEWPGSVLEFRKVIGPLTDPVAHGGHARELGVFPNLNRSGAGP